MKTSIKQHFILIKNQGKRSYTLDVYQIIKKGELQRVGSCMAQNGSHKGETSEAYTFLKSLKLIKPSILKAISEAQKLRTISGSYDSYYYYDFSEKFGLTIELL